MRKKNRSDDRMKNFGAVKSGDVAKENKTKKEKGAAASMIEYASILSWDREYDCGSMVSEEGKEYYMDILQITCKDLNRIGNSELNYDNIRWDKLYMTYSGDLKIIALNFPCDFREQLSYIKKVAMKTENPVLFRSLEKEYEKLQRIAVNSMDREYFLAFYADTKDELVENRAKIKGALNRGIFPTVTGIPAEKKDTIIHILNNLNDKISVNMEAV